MTRRGVRRTCLSLAILAALVAALLWAGYGFDTAVLGHKLTVNDPRRPGLLAILFLLGYFAAGGRIREPSPAQIDAVQGWFARLRWVRAVALRPELVVGVLCVGSIALAARFGSHVAGGSDSYGYVSQAVLWTTGHVRQPQPWAELVPWPAAAYTFTPLGYYPSPGSTDLVPIYAPGYPLVMALAMLIGGYRAAFWVSPISAVVTIWATYVMGRRLGSRWAGVIGAWLVATSPAFLMAYLAAPMSDVPVTAAWTVAFVCAIGVSSWSAVAAGVMAGLAILIRLNFAGLVAVLGLWFIAEGWRARAQGVPGWWRRTLGFSVGLAPAIVAVALYNWSMYGSPLRSGYGDINGWFALPHVLPNVRRYSQWLTETQTPLVWVGVVALFLPIASIWQRREVRWAVMCGGCFVLALWIQYAFYMVFDAWWYLRFLLPSYPFIMLGLGQVLVALGRRGRVLRLAFAVAVIWIGVRGIVIGNERFAFTLRLGDSRYAMAARAVREATEPGSIILSMQHSGSLRFYSGRMPLRYDYLDERWLDRTVEWLSARGVHSYALLDEAEVEVWRTHFDALNELRRLDWPPIRVIVAGGRTMLYDLGATQAGASINVAQEARDLEIVPPVRRDRVRLQK
jgi:hypothetical protein